MMGEPSLAEEEKKFRRIMYVVIPCLVIIFLGIVTSMNPVESPKKQSVKIGQYTIIKDR
jgi:hypothetical protein